MKKPQQVSAEEELLKEISRKLDGIVTVLAMQHSDRDKQIELLALGGMDSAVIATLLGTTSAAVRSYSGWKRVKKSRNSAPLGDVGRAETIATNPAA